MGAVQPSSLSLVLEKQASSLLKQLLLSQYFYREFCLTQKITGLLGGGILHTALLME